MENPGECSVCLTTFDESDRRPRTLLCGHTFCSPCLGDMMEGGQLFCPTCRIHHSATCVTQLPINYSVEAFVKHLEASGKTSSSENSVKVTTAGATYQKQYTGISKKLQSLLEEQKSSVSSVVAGNQEVQSQLNQYHAQLADWKTQHLHLLDKLYGLVEQNKVALEFLEQEDKKVLSKKEEGEEGEKQLEVVLGCLNTVNTAQEIGPAINHADHCLVESENWRQKCHELFPDVTTVTTTMKVCEVTRMALDTLTAGTVEVTPHLVDPALSIMEKVQMVSTRKLLQVEDLHSMRPPIKRLVEAGHVFGVHEGQSGLHSSRITVKNDQLYLHCLLKQPPPSHAHTLPVNKVVGALDPSSTLVFLDLSWTGSARRRVHIRLSPDTSLARQFVLLCTGQCGHSYLNSVFLYLTVKGQPGECVRGGDYEHNSGKGGASLLSHPQHWYRQSGRAGAVFSWLGPGSEKSAEFGIITRDSEADKVYGNVIGEVESGLEVVMAAVNHCNIRQVIVVDCGVVVSL